MSEVPANWFEGFFEHEWLDYLAAGDPDRTEKTVDFLVERLGLHEGSRVLDVACGGGRVSVPLARRGCRVTGIDLSPNSLERAKEAAAAAGVSLDLIRLDMRELDFDARFDAAINVFTSFGYFERSEDDQRVLGRIARALVSGGVFLIDHINPIWIMQRFAAKDWTEFDDGTLFLEERRYNQLRGRHEAVWTFVRPEGGRTRIEHSLRAYTPTELREMLERADLEVDAAWGSWDGDELGDGGRTILRARKPARA